jgi:4-amino-4-deoxyprephenate dehydrogenase
MPRPPLLARSVRAESARAESVRTVPVAGVVGRCVVAGGGAVGAMFAGLLAAAGADVAVVDIAPAGRADIGARSIRGDITAPDAALIDELAAADVVVLAVPADVAQSALPHIAASVRTGTLLVDTLSVKTGIVAAIRREAPHAEAVSLNPMFAPSLGVRGRPIAIVRITGGPRGDELIRLLADAGARVVEMTADEHDRISALTQAMTHAAIISFGIALGELGLDIETIAAVAPPPHATMLALLARIGAGAPETYWDVQAANPYAAETRARLARALSRVNALVALGDESGFGLVLDEARRTLGPENEHFRDRCAAIFA